MSEQELGEIVQITVEDFSQDDHTGKIPVYALVPYIQTCTFTLGRVYDCIDVHVLFKIYIISTVCGF